MSESRTALALTKIGVLYLVALCGVVLGLVVSPLSAPLLLALIALIVIFFTFSMLTFGVASILVGVMLLDLLIPGFKAYLNTRLRSSRLNRGRGESSPAGLRLSEAKLRRLCPEVFAGARGVREWMADRCGGKAALRHLIADQLRNGDSRAAVVLSLSPLRVAAYADKLDAVALLAFPDELVADYDLRIFGRLVAVNRYFRDVESASDLDLGPLGIKDCSNFRPFVADFLCDDQEEIRALRKGIREDEWRRATFLGRQYLERHGDLHRDGRPLQSINSATPATPSVKNEDAGSVG